MTVMSWHWRLARPRRRTALPRHLDPARLPMPPGRPAYRDPLFADPALVEDDTRRLARRGDPAR